MLISNDIFEAFLNCHTKAILYSKGETGEKTEITVWRRRLHEEFTKKAGELLVSGVSKQLWTAGTPSLTHIQKGDYRTILDYESAGEGICSHIPALIKTPTRGRRRFPYAPVRFVPRRKIERSDKLLVAFDALVLTESWHTSPSIGQIVHGPDYAITEFPLGAMLNETRRTVQSIANQLTKDVPAPVLKKHCVQCEFQSRCRSLAVEKDDLSLLGSISAKERMKQQEKGIFTVTQLSYTFRPRRRRSSKNTVNKVDHALRARSIRKQQIHVVGTPNLAKCGTPVYLDVEGDSDRDFYYLIGLRISESDASTHHSFWADDPASERRMWIACLNMRIPAKSSSDSNRKAPPVPVEGIQCPERSDAGVEIISEVDGFGQIRTGFPAALLALDSFPLRT